MPSTRPRDAATLILLRRDGPEPRVLMGRRSGGHVFMPGKWVFPGGRIDRRDYGPRPLTPLPPDVAASLGATARLARQAGRRLADALAQTAIRETFEECGLILGQFEENGLRGDFSSLRYVARAITPPGRHRRFDARFLLADAERLHSLRPVDSRELGDIDWFTLAQARCLDLPTVTRAVLDVVALHARGEEPAPPFWHWARARPDGAI